MVLVPSIAATLAMALSLTPMAVFGHPGEKYGKREALEEMGNAHVVNKMNARALEACQNSPAVKARKERAIARRAEKFAQLRRDKGIEKAPGLHRRDAAAFEKWAALSHNKTGTSDFTKDTPNKDIFGANTSCVLTPDNANGPYLQFIDVHTCEPVVGVLIDTWSCNATGAYSGVSAKGEGGLGTTYLRGVQPVDEDGVVNFDTIFPGHYQGRATHQHLIAHVGSEILPNGTYSRGRVAYLSQLFFDQTLNLEDWFTGYAATSEYDPFPNYVSLGNELEDGLLVWAELGLNTSSDWDHYAPYASTWKEGGGYDNPDFDFWAVAGPPPTHG
ncbi:putative GPI anchored dioxygenase [Daldinia loculata]|uniref:putative GPI anchored dioxygenase n=1 Tax=Daldinia loculata TaxID=103429 RepID=UPI0020C3A3AD|nr:putative GPI anchored dioxygenase [Daldinia loculata]KAI1644499.1 putative GPI anchored dioxygenase [Daldinia loculata]